MSYVIQNFFTSQFVIFPTPRSKLLFLVLNINNFFLVFKQNNFYLQRNFYNFSHPSYFPYFYNFFFAKQLKFIFKNNLNLKLTAFYKNNLFKSSFFFFYWIFLSNIDKKCNNRRTASLASNLSIETTKMCSLFSIYYYPVKLLNELVTFDVYKNFFYFLIYFSSFFWFQNSLFFRFYLNFLIVNKNLNFNEFFNSYFLNVYNF